MLGKVVYTVAVLLFALTVELFVLHCRVKQWLCSKLGIRCRCCGVHNPPHGKAQRRDA